MNWIKLGQYIYEEASFIGHKVSLNSNGNILAIGVPYHDNQKGLKFYLFYVIGFERPQSMYALPVVGICARTIS